MTVLRIDIKRALDELISNEEGMRFQGLAIVLAKQKWPDLIANERKWDRGLDAYAPASVARDGIGKGLASSVTATLNKLQADAQRVRKHFSDVSVLIFATPVAVTSHTANEWAKTIKRSVGFDLVVMPREDIITELMLPSNAAICRSFLAIAAPVEDSVNELLARAQQAASEVITSWFAHPRLAGRPRLGLQASRLNEEGRDTGEVFDLDSLHRALLESRRIVLEAPAGRGKTTMLLQLAERPDSQGLPLLIDLPAWVTSGGDILEFIARSRWFMSRGINAQDLARLGGVAHYRFLLNGWNEVSDSYSERAQGALAELERNFPTAGIIVATRAHPIRPPLPGSFRVRLLPLSRIQRAEYLQQALGGRAAELGGLLDSERVLDDLTRTPLILSEVTSIFLSGEAIPRAKMGVLDAVLRLVEQTEHHRGQLARPPLNGHARDYLTKLALRMTSKGDVTIQEVNARAAVHSVSLALGGRGQIAAAPEPTAILNALCAHHVLERLEYPGVAFRFEHQQVQEFLAATELARQLYDPTRGGDPEANRRYACDYVNQPVWEEPLRMVAEEIGARSGAVPDVDAVAAGARLIEMALLVDPVFAADLSRLCGPSVWGSVRGRVGQRLRAWYQMVDQHHRQCALAAMLATGSEDFVDTIVPLLSGDDQQVRLRTYRTGSGFHLTTLGPDWRHVIRAWNDEQRSEFVAEVVREGRLVEVAEDFARTDPSPKVRRVALQALKWVGATDALSRVLTDLDDQAFEEVLRDRVLDALPAEVKGRALEAYEKLVASVGEPRARVEIRLAAAELGPSTLLDGLKEDVASWPSGHVDDGGESLLKSALEVLRRADSPWVSCWVAERIVDGSLWPDRWVSLVSNISEVLREDLFAKLCAAGLEPGDDRRIIAVLGANADVDLIKRAFSGLCRIRTETARAAGEGNEGRWAIARQLQDLIRAVPPDIAVAGTLSGVAATLDGAEYEVVTELFGRVNSEDSALRGQLREDLRQGLRQYLKDGVSVALAHDDFGGGLKARIAIALARVGEPGDMSDLERLVWADIERVRRGRAARLRHERSAMADGAVMSWSTWYVRAIVWLDAEGAEQVLLALLSEFEYEQDAAAALLRMARTQTMNRRDFGLNRRDYSIIWDRREGRRPTGIDDGRRRRYATAIKQRIATIMEARTRSVDPDSFNSRLKGLATKIAALDGRESADFVMEILALPGKWDEWTRSDAMEALVFSGARLSAEAALRVLNATIDHARSRGFHDQEAGYLLGQCLSLLAFVDPCSVGLARIREVVAATRLAPYQLGEIVTALGHSRCTGALDLLLELATVSEGGFESLATEWIDAVAALGTPASTRVLLGFVDPDIEHPALEQYLKHYHRERLASRVVEIAQSDSAVKDRLYSLCARQLSPAMRFMLADVLARLGTRDALIAGLGLIHDRVNPAVPYELLRGIENLFVERRPSGDSGHWYTLEPRSANEIRSRLFEMMLNDNSRKRSAWALLGEIESWRLEYGRPASEPRHPAFELGKPWPPIELAGEIGGTSAGS